jgi:iron complex outermembrane receptor protein
MPWPKGPWQSLTWSAMKPVLMRTVACELVLLGLALLAAPAQEGAPDLTTLKIEDLMNLDVTSASKKEQKISRVPAAIFVITQEDIRRSGAIDIPDVLRMVPGLEVAQINASTWAISARGFNGEYSNKLLVLIDGRTVYTPLFSGVYWDAQDVPLDSIERIEVIRGPGATVWGANAVNGVINIITQSARETQSGVATAEGGTLIHGAGRVRYGGRIGARGYYRAFADGFEIGHFLTPGHQNAEDDWYRFHGGFRLDEEISAKDSLTMEGEGIRGNAGEIVPAIISVQPPVNGNLDLRDRFSGWNVLGRWKRALSPGSETTLQVYFDRSTRGDTTYGTGLNTFDIDFQHHGLWGPRQDFVWGLGYRLNSDEIAHDFRFSATPTALNFQIFSAFVQDEIAIRPDHLYTSIGTKLEHDYFNGFNMQPTARITWTPEDRDMLWAAVSGAQRTPSRGETGVRENETVAPGPANLPLLVSVFGNPAQKNEHLIATEAGLRKAFAERLSLDSAVFFNHYQDLRSGEPGAPRLETDRPPVYLLVPFNIANLLRGETHGIEIFANVKLAPRWTLSPGYTFLTMHLHPDASSLDTTTAPVTEGGIPNQQAQLRSNVNLPGRWQWTTSAYFVGRLIYPKVPSYTRLDSNLSWQASERFSLGLVGQNLLQNFHREYSGGDSTVNASEIRRSAYARVTWRF